MAPWPCPSTQGPMGFWWVPSGVLARRDLSCFQAHHGLFLLEAPGASRVRAGPASPALGEAATAGFLGAWALASRDTSQEHLPARLSASELVQTRLWNVGVVAAPPRSPGEVTSCGSSREPPPLTQDGCRIPAGAACCTSKPCPVHTVPHSTKRGKPAPASAGVGPAFVRAGLDLLARARGLLTLHGHCPCQDAPASRLVPGDRVPVKLAAPSAAQMWTLRSNSSHHTLRPPGSRSLCIGSPVPAPEVGLLPATGTWSVVALCPSPSEAATAQTQLPRVHLGLSALGS